MAENSKIEWTDHTFNPWIGCTKVSPACDNCYAEAWEARFGHSWGPHVRRRTSPANWRKPLAWDRAAASTGKRARVFCASLSDVFDNDRSITSGWRGDLWHLIHRTPRLDWLLLTKRPQNVERYLRPEEYGDLPEWGNGWPNVWLGTTVENQTEAERRIPHLLAVPAAVRFLSCEPLLGPVDLGKAKGLPVYWEGDKSDGPLQMTSWGRSIGQRDRRGWVKHSGNMQPWLDWVICGGESGPGARPMYPEWARSLRDQCVAAGVAFHFKQWGEYDHYGRRVGKKAAGRIIDGRTWDELPTQARAALTGEGETPAEPPWRIVTAPVAGPAPHLAWRAYSPERPGIGKHYAETEEAAIAKCEAALTGEGETNG